MSPIRVANCSGFYGDKLSAAKELVEGGPIDVLTGDYLAELTMAILFHQKLKRGEDAGYVGTFLKQLKDIASTCQDKGIKIVTNAGGLNPLSMAKESQKLLDELGLHLKIAAITGDNIVDQIQTLQKQGEAFKHMDKGTLLADSSLPVVSANTYLGAWGIKEALDLGADLVICPRVTDAALVIGPAAWHYNWQRDDYAPLAGALVAGHILECGAQCTGGNYAFFEDVPSFKNIGYPIAEISENGDSIITKHADTGGLVSVGTVTAQLLYEIGAPAYINPDVIAHFDSVSLSQESENRVLVSGTKGSSPTETHKVCINLAGAYKNGGTLYLTGLDIEKKAQILEEAFFDSLGGKEQFDSVSVRLHHTNKDNPNSNEEATGQLRIFATSKDPKKVGRLFSAKLIELGLANYPGFYGAPGLAGSEKPSLIYWPSLIHSKHVKQNIHIEDSTTEILATHQLGFLTKKATVERVSIPKLEPEPTQNILLGRLFGTRSGDKGGSANLGLWAKTARAYQWCYHLLTVETLKDLLPDLAQFNIIRYELPNIYALNFVIEGILEDGVSSNNRMDSQAKSLGEYLRAKHIEVPLSLIKEADL